MKKLIPLPIFSKSAKADSPVVQNMLAEFAKSAAADLTVVKNYVYL